jgi:Ser-tRNA(Ala) deacylase AlaX
LRYQNEAALRELVTTVVSWQPLTSLGEAERALFKTVLDSSDGAVATKETIFHPQGGGQPSDVGVITTQGNPQLQFDVKLVRKLPNGLVLHAGNHVKPVSAGTEAEDDIPPPVFHELQSVQLSVDDETRNYHSRLHTAGHLVGLAVRRLEKVIGVVSELKANHAPGSAWVEFGGSIAGEHKDAIQNAVDEMVASNLPVLVRWWDSQQMKDGCMSVPDVAPTDAGELWRVVEVEGLGAYPCGGTHLPATGDVGKVVIRKISRAKGKSKVSYEVAPAKA